MPIKAQWQSRIFKLEWEIIGEIGQHGFDSALFSEIQDFQKTIALIPTSKRNRRRSRTMILMGLAQKYLRGNLLLNDVFRRYSNEIKEEKGLEKHWELLS